MIKYHHCLGLAGASPQETKAAILVSRVFKYVTLIVIFVLAFQWEYEYTSKITGQLNLFINFFVWSFFLTEVLTLLLLVKDKRRYLRGNWMYLLIILFGATAFFKFEVISHVFHITKPILVVLLLVPWLDICLVTLSDGRLATTLLTAGVVIVLAGIFISGIDPAFRNPWEGIWWAWVTMSTVGYGDFVPVSLPGRIFGCCLILMGLCLFSIITANFSAIFIKRGEKNRERYHADMLLIAEKLEQTRISENELRALLNEVSDRLRTIESKLKS